MSTCSICLEVFTDPRHLPCMHVFCGKCLQSLVKSAGTSDINCPSCRLGVNITNVQQLPVAFLCNNLIDALKYFRPLSNDLKCCLTCEAPFADGDEEWICMDCFKPLCDGCKKDHLETDGMGNHTIRNSKHVSQVELPGGLIQQVTICSDHKRRWEYVCETCNKLICVSCGLLNHNSCNKKDISIIKEDYKTLLKDKIVDMKTELTDSDRCVVKMKSNKAAFESGVKKAENHVKITVEDLRQKLTLLEKDLLERLQHESSSCLENLDRTIMEENVYSKSIKCLIKRTEAVLETGAGATIVHTNLHHEETLKTLSPKSNPLMHQAYTDLGITFDGKDVDVREAFGRVSVRASSSSLGKLSSKEVYVKDVGRIHTGISINKDGTLCLTDGTRLHILTRAGELVRSLVDPATTNRQLFDVYSEEEAIYAVDTNTKAVCLYSQDGTIRESLPIEVSQRSCIAGWKNELFVSNYNENCIIHVTGFHEPNPTSKAILKNEVYTPQYLAVNSDVLVVSCHGCHQVKVYRRDTLQLLFTHGSIRGWHAYHFRSPRGVCIDVMGNILVADSNNYRIHVLDANGNLLGHISTSIKPGALCLDHSCRLYVTEYAGKSLLMCTYCFG